LTVLIRWIELRDRRILSFHPHEGYVSLSLGLSLPMDYSPAQRAGRLARLPGAAWSLLPGVLLCLSVAGGSVLLQGLERRVFGRPWLETLVLAILLGATVRAFWPPGARWKAGIDFCAKPVLEVAIVLLGVSVSTSTLLSAGRLLPLAIAATVAVSIAGGYGLGRAFGLNRRMATLIACGTSICGNSAIAAIAPLIGADAEDVAASISFTAVLGVLTVLGLPILGGALHQSPTQFGALAGLTVYAVPQVLAATAPMGPAAMQFGALVKLTRVLMLGPVFAILSLALSRAVQAPPGAGRRSWPPVHRLLPWFIVGFLACMAARSAGLVPNSVVSPAAAATTFLTTLSMAALGLTTDVRCLRRAGGRAAATATASLLLLGATAVGLVMALGVR
jgi:uncharacterized integral membrane protein (TIGR00698 family)